MKQGVFQRPLIALLILLPIVLGIGVLRGMASTDKNIVAQTFDGDKCRIILEKTATRLGWPTPEIYVNTYDNGNVTCQMTYANAIDGTPMQVTIQISVSSPEYCADCEYYCQNPTNECECIDVHGFTGRLGSLNVPNGLQLNFCDASCNLYFDVQTLTEGDTPIDPLPVTDALYYSALEMNCCQAVEAAPPVENPPETIQPPVTIGPQNGDQSIPENPLPPDVGDQEQPNNPIPPEDGVQVPPDIPDMKTDLGTLARNPLVSLGGALAGTIMGVVVSLWLNAGRSMDGLVSIIKSLWTPDSTPPAPPAQPTGVTTIPATDWEAWESNLPPQVEDPLVADPDMSELRANPMDVYQVKDTVGEFYKDDIPKWRWEKIDPQKTRILDKSAFDAQYQNFYKTPNTDGTTGFADPNGFEIFIDQENSYTYTPIHETIHLSSNPEFGLNTNTKMDEATTEFFTRKIANQKKGKHLTAYDDGAKVINELEKSVGSTPLREAYFGEGKDGIDALVNAVDEKYGKGAFTRLVKLVDEKKYLKARALLKGEVLFGTPVKQ
jgi:hypothetical protein